MRKAQRGSHAKTRQASDLDQVSARNANIIAGNEITAVAMTIAATLRL